MNLKSRTTRILLVAVSFLCILPALVAIGMMSPFYDRPQIANLPLSARPTGTLVPTITIDTPQATAPQGNAETGAANNETPQPDTTGAVPTPLLTPSTNDEPVDYATVTSSGVANLREGPGLGFDVVTGARAGEVLPVFGRSSDGAWLLVDHERSLWIATELVRLSGDTASIPVTGLEDSTP